MADKKPTDEKLTEKKAVKKSSVVKKANPKKAPPVKKRPVKKASIKKKSAVTDKSLNVSSAQKGKEKKEPKLSVQTLVKEIRAESDKRYQQVTSLVDEIRKGFINFSDHSSSKDSAREEEMTKLYQSLQGAFTQVKASNEEKEDRSMLILNALSDSILKDHENTLKEVNEQKKLHDEKMQQLDKVYKRHSGRNRLLAIPGVIIGVIAIIYMFYVVTIMENAMTSMSSDIHTMQSAVVNMSNNMNVMANDTESMNKNMILLNRNIAFMSRDLNILTYNVSPTMKGMRDMMPWIN